MVAFLVGAHERWRSPRLARLLLLGLAFIATWSALNTAITLQAHARAWDGVDARLRQASGSRGVIELPAIDNVYGQVWHVRPDPEGPINQCIASMYGLEGVTAPESRFDF